MKKAEEKKTFENLTDIQSTQYKTCYDDFAYSREHEKWLKKICPEIYVNPPVDNTYEDLKFCNENLNKAEGLNIKLINDF
ncbi:hypothetical protein GVAV_000260 [Gurleya vavrai]